MSVRRMLEICRSVATAQARAFPGAKADNEVEKQDNLWRAAQAAKRAEKYTKLMEACDEEAD